jgi:hypothetical protein
MLKSEFIEIMKELAPDHAEPTEKEYRAIELVYTYHPLVGNHEKIVKLWLDYGNALIEDMTPRALAVQEAEDELEQARYSVEEAQRILACKKAHYDSLFRI